MGAGIFFFTDPGLLAPQMSGQAFGPVDATHYRVTDLHTRASAATQRPPAIAMCDGMVCAQYDAAGTLSLILKPSQAPPFDFPPISYIIYKGIAPASLLDGTHLDLDHDYADSLVRKAKKIWRLPANGRSPSSVPDETALGLHLTDLTFIPVVDRPRFADDAPIDNLFYLGDPTLQLPPVKAGDWLGAFPGPSDPQGSGTFGIEIVIERLGHRPKIGLARKVENQVKAPSLGSGPSAEFLQRHEKEAILGFIDPCAFWGSFGARPVKVRTTTEGGVESKLAWDDLLLGRFANLHRTYLDIRNEHGHSLDYYRDCGRTILLDLDGNDLAQSAVDYYGAAGSDWPLLHLEPAALPAALGDFVEARVALPNTADSLPLVYLSTGYVVERNGAGKLRIAPAKGQAQFFGGLREIGGYLEPALIALPVVQDGGVARLRASYTRLHHFKRSLPGASATAAPVGLAPPRTGPLQNLFPLPGSQVFPRELGRTLVKTFADRVYVEWPSDGSPGFVARPGFARDQDNVYLFLAPTAAYAPTTGLSEPMYLVPFEDTDQSRFLPHWLQSKMRRLRLEGRTFEPAAGLTVSGLYEAGPRSPDLAARFMAVALSATDYEFAIAPDSGTAILLGSAFLSLDTEGLRNILPSADGGRHYAVAAVSTFLQTAAVNPAGSPVTRVGPRTFPTFYGPVP